MQSTPSQQKTILAGTYIAFMLLMYFLIPARLFAADFTATSLGDYGNVTVMEVNGNYDADTPDGKVNAIPRQIIAQEFFKTHKDEYDFLVIFTNFDFAMPEKEKALAFYEGVKNDTQGIGADIFDNTNLYGSNGKLQGTIDMGNLANKATDPLDPKFEETLGVLSHEMMHRWAAYAKFKDTDGTNSSALLGRDSSHWSFLLDSGGSLMYGNTWQDNKNGTFTTTTSQGQMKFYSPLELYLMGMIDKSDMPSMLLITNPDADSAQLPQAGVTVTGTAQYVTMDQIIAANGPRIPDASSSQKKFKSAFIFITRPGTFAGDDLYKIENLRNGAVTRFSILTDGAAIMQVAPTTKDDVPVNPGVTPPATMPRTNPNLNEGVQWLMAAQQADGSWQDLSQTKERDTAAALPALKSFGPAQQNYQAGLLWLGTVSSGNLDYLARKIEAFAGAGQDTRSLVQDLLARRNEDGGWGSEAKYPSGNADTVLALRALSAAGYMDPAILSAAIGYLKSEQNSDGGWGGADKGSTVQETSNVLSAFNQYRSTYQLGDAIMRGTALLVSKRNFDGGFGNSPSTVYDTARAAMTLGELNASGSIVSQAVGYILSRQSDNGSWNQSAYETALAVETVYKATIDPDLSIKPEDISFIPASVKSLPANVVINANIRNLGSTSVPQAKVVIYDGNKATGTKVGEQMLAFPGQASTEVTFSVTVIDGNEHVYMIVVDPDNLVKESNKLNNTAVNALYPQPTHDFEVLSSDIALSVNPVNMLQDVTITSKITNKGTTNAYNVQVKYYIDDPVSPYEIATQTIDIPAGTTVKNQTTWHANKAGINMPLSVLVDPFNNFNELSETNNKAASTITVNSATAPNLSVSYKDMVITPSPANQGGNAMITAAIKNDGISPASNVKVNFYEGVPGADGVIIGTQTIPIINAGDNIQTAMTWTNIPDSGEKIIYVKVDPDNQITEIRKDDNDAFTMLTILNLPDLMLSDNSIVFSPSAPKEGDKVVVITTIQNNGEQGAANILVRFSEGGAVLATQTISSLIGGATTTASFIYDTTGEKGAHTITVTADTNPEQNKSNNSASRTFGVQDSNLWVTEPYFSPNGDGVKDSTQLFFRLDAPRTVTVSVVNKKGETVRTFSRPNLANITAGNVTWDGLSADGKAIPDGTYQIQLWDAAAVLGSLGVTVDTNRSPLTEAVGTKYLLNNNLTFALPFIWPEDWVWLKNDSGILFTIRNTNQDVPGYPAGLYTMAPTGEDIVRIIPADWTEANTSYAYTGFRQTPSNDSEKVAFTFWKADKETKIALNELWIVDTDGRNRVPIEQSDSSYSIEEVKWSTDGGFLAYVIYRYSGTYEVWIVDINTKEKKKLDAAAYYCANIKWSPNGNEIAYIAGVMENYSVQYKLRKADKAGNITAIDTSQEPEIGFSYNNNFFGLIWLGSQKMIYSNSQGRTIWLIDMSGNGTHALISNSSDGVAASMTPLALSPDNKSVVFDEYNGGTVSLKIADSSGNLSILYEADASIEFLGEGVGGRLSNAVWLHNGEKIAFVDSAYTKLDACLYERAIYVIDMETKKETISKIAGALCRVTNGCSNDEYNACLEKGQGMQLNKIDGWMSDNMHVLIVPLLIFGDADLSNLIFTIHSETGERKGGLPFAVDQYSIGHVAASPQGIYVTYGYDDLWAMSSLLNLTADLRVVRQKSAVILKGIAADLNFEFYQLEYADSKSPDVWTLVQPPSNVPVINDVFTTWVPPYEGTFSVRLTVWDKAGNTAVSRKNISWGQYSSITNLYKSLEIFSPNGDGIKDTVELHYRVLEPMHLEFNIYNEANSLVKTYYKDHTAPTEDTIQWDGTDESLNIVPDGKYKIKVFDYEFFVEVDNTPPQIAAKFGNIYEKLVPALGTIFYSYLIDLSGHIVDGNIKTWNIAFGEGDNPQEWHEYTSGGSQLVGQDKYGNPLLDPIQDVAVSQFEVKSGVLDGKKLRITAEDFAGNKNSFVTGYAKSVYLAISIEPGLDPCDQQTGKGISYSINDKFLTLRMQIQSNHDSRYYQWTDFQTFTSPNVPEGRFQYNLPDVRAGGEYSLRIIVLGESGNSYTSAAYALRAEKTCESGTVALALDIKYPEVDCGLTSNKAAISSSFIVNGDVVLKTLSYVMSKPNGTVVLRAVDLSREKWDGVSIDTAVLSEGSYTVQAIVDYVDALNRSKEAVISGTLIVDRVLPTAQITYPTKSSMLCPVINADAKGNWYGLPIEGIAMDNTNVQYYELYYGVGENPSVWLPATTRINGKAVAIKEIKSVQGRLGVWDVTGLRGTTYSLKLKVVDAVGNVSCATTSFSMDTSAEIASLTIDKKLFSPNTDGVLADVKVGYEIDENATVAISVFKLVSSSLDITPVRTIAAAKPHLAGIDNAIWDGNTDGGTSAPDGRYGIAVSAIDSCGNTAQRWIAVEADNTPPDVAISYPKVGDPIGTVVEVKGRALDTHFQTYALEYGHGDVPSEWTLISSGLRPAQDAVLGVWNTFGRDGRWTLRLSATDTAGNKSATTSVVDLSTKTNLMTNLTVTPRVFSPNNDGKLDATDISYEVTDACDVIIELLDAGGQVKQTFSTAIASAGTYTFSWNGKGDSETALADGLYTARLTATLSANANVTQTESVTAVIDATPAAIDIKQPANNSYVRSDVTVLGSITDANIAEYTISITGADAGGRTEEVDRGNQTRADYAFGILNSLADGTYVLTARAKDLGELVTEKTVTFIVDKTAPVIALEAPKEGGYYGGKYPVVDISGSIAEQNLNTFTLRYGEGDDPLEWKELTSGTAAPTMSTLYSWKVGGDDGVKDGKYTLSLLVTDKAGASSEARIKLIIDNTPPTATITSLLEGAYIKQAVNVKGTAFDQNLDKCTLEISEGECNSAYKWAQLKSATSTVQDAVLGAWQVLPADGDYCFRLTTQDKVGLTTETKVNVKVDTHPPTATVLSGKVDNKTTATLTWTANTEPDLDGYNIYRVGQKINTELVPGSEFQEQNLIEGVYAYTVKAVDFAGNESIASNEVKLKIDLAGPTARISGPQDGARISGLIDIKGTAYSADDFKQYRVFVGPGVAPTTWNTIRTSPVPISYGVLAQWDTFGLGEGQVYSIKLEAEDMSGNISTYHAGMTIDNTPPVGPYLIAAVPVANSADVALTWQPNLETDLAGYLLYRNDQLANVSGIVIGDMKPYLIQGTNYLDKSLPDGTFTYYMIAMDQAGNMSELSSSLTVTIDTRPPHATIVDPTNTSKFGGKIMVKAESPDLDIASVQFQYQSILSSPTITTDWINLGSLVTTASFIMYMDPGALGLVYGDYRLRAVATDKGQKTDPTPGFITITYTDLTPPAAPSGLNALVSGGTVTLTWTATESDLAGYNVYRTSGGTKTKINTALITAVSQPTYQEAGLADGNYLYDVTAVDTYQNESKTSTQANAIVYAPVITQPYTPTGQSTIQVRGTNASPGAAVSLFADTASGLATLGTATVDSSGTFTISAALNLGENRLTARAFDSAGNVSKDAAIVVVVYNDTPTAPTGLIAAVHNSDTHLTWNPNPETDLFGYNVYRDGAKLNKPDAVISSQATYSASSSIDPVLYGPEAAMDASATSYWRPQDRTSAADPSWWEMDLASSELISHVEVHWGTDIDSAGNAVVYAAKDYEIQVWSGYAWITQANLTGNTIKDNVFDFKPSYRTDGIRIFITDSADSNSAKQVRLAEISVIKDNIVSAGTQPAYDDLNLANKQYSYRVAAVDAYGFESQPSTAATTTVAITPPDQPANLSVTPEADGGLRTSWTYNGNPAAGYNLYRGFISGGTYNKVNSTLISQKSYLDRGLTSGVKYYYVVTAVDASGNEGGYSNEASGTPLNIVLSKPIIFFPTMAGLPVKVYEPETTIAGDADPDVDVVFYRADGSELGRTRTTSQNERRVVDVPEYEGYGIELSPNQKMLSYNGYKDGEYRSFIMNIDTQQVTAYPIDRDWPHWSPDGSKIVYFNYDNEYLEIFDPESETFIPLTNASYYEDNASWSPDSNKVAFETDRGGGYDVWIKDLKTGELTQISRNGGVWPSWSHDGTRIAYNSSNNLVIWNVHDGVETQLGAYYPIDIRWSSDGKSICFVNDYDGQIYVIHIDSLNLVQVSDKMDAYSSPRWLRPGKVIYLNSAHSSLYQADAETGETSTLVQNASIEDLAVHPSDLITYGDSYQFITLFPAGRFETGNVSLAPGENIISATAVDTSGNTSEPSEPVSITYDLSRLPDLSISAGDLYLYPPYPIAGEQIAVNAVVRNTSQVDISNAEVTVYVWNALNQMEQLKSETIPVITAGSSAVVTGTWNSTGKIGDNRLVVVVDPNDAIVESDETNNMAIKDFYVAGHVGMSMSASLDAAQYTSNRNVNISAIIRNTGPAANAVLSVRIEDANGYPVYTFDPMTVNIAYASEAVRNLAWNTGSTYAGSYVIHAVLKDASAAMLADTTTLFTILSDVADDLTVTTDKIGYSPRENVITSFTIKNFGTNSIIPTLQATLFISNAEGVVLFSEVKTATNLLPGASVVLNSVWNSGLNMPGDYHATVVVSFDGGAAVTKSAGFKINTILLLTGTITASPSIVPMGNAAQISYTLANAGNADAVGYTARITILDPETQTIMQTSDEVLDIAANASRSGQVTVNTSGYGLRTYTAILQTLSQGITKNIANTPFVVKDLTPPVISLITPTANGMYSSLVSIAVLANDNASGVDNIEYQRDSGQWQLLPIADPAQGRYGATWNTVPADNGSHVISFRATDKAGNTSVPVLVNITIQSQTDTIPPALTISTLPNGALTNNAVLNIAGTVTDNIAVQGVTLNNVAVTINADGTFSQAISLTTGTNTITTIATDTAGNTTTDTRTIILDRTAPQITITSPADNSVVSNPGVIVSGAIDKASTILISLNSGPTVTAATDATTFSLPVTLATNTNNTIFVYATDLAGNSSTAKRSVTHDDTNPALAITIPNQDMGTNQASVLISGTVSDLTDVSLLVTCPTASIDVVSTPTSTTWSVNITNMRQGTNGVTVRAADQAGNSTSVVRNIIYTSMPITIDPVTTPTNNSQQQITGTMELASTVTVSCSTATVGTITYPTAMTWQTIIFGMTEGTNIISATAIDLEGHTSDPVTATIVLDTEAPDTSIISGPAVLTNTNTASFSFISTEQGFTFECKLDTADYEACASPMNYISLIDRTHTFMVRATDTAGNTDQTPAVYTWTVDTIPPMTIIIGAPSGLTNARSASLTVTGDDVIAFQYNLDFEVFSAETSTSTPIVLSGLLDGTHKVFVVGKDSAGNWQAGANATVATWIVDITPPALVLSTIGDGSYTNNPVLNIAGTASDTNGIRSIVVSSQTVTPSTSDNVNYTFSQAISLTTGTNTITTIATDAAGNTTTDTRTIILDRTAPQITITSPADNSVVSNPGVIVSGAIDKASTILISLNSGPTVTAATNTTTFSLPVTLATNTNNTMFVYATDLAGNSSTAKRSVTHDDTNPALAITIPNQDMGTNQASVLISGTVSDLTDVSLLVTCPTASIDVVSTPTSTTWSVNITNMRQGTNGVTVRAADQAGNSTSVVRNVIYTSTPITIDPVTTPTNNSQQLITGAMELASTVTVSCSTATVGTITYPTATTWQTIIFGMTEGANIISATATDLEGRTSDSVFVTIKLDTHAPVTTPSPSPSTYYNTVTVTLAANEPAIIYYTTDGTTPTTSAVYKGPFELKATTTINFFAVDMAANPESVKSVTYTVIPDATPPVTTISAGNPNYTSGDGKLYVTNSSKFSLSATDDVSGVKTTTYRLEGGTWTTYVSPFSLQSEGTHTIGYMSTDNASNPELEKGIYPVVDNTPPVSLITVGGPPVTVSTAITITAVDSASGVQMTEYAIDSGSWITYSGSFTFATYSQGTHTINYRSTDNVMNVETSKSRTVQLWTDRPMITTTKPADGTVSAPYNQTLAATGGTLPYMWSMQTGMLPAGLLLNPTTGMISGTPASAGTSTITFQVVDNNGMTNTKVLSFTVYGPLSITTNALASGITGSSYSQTLSATGGKTSYVWSISAGSLPAGLSLNSSSGVIYGTPISAGTSTFTVQVKDANNAMSSKALAIIINSVLSIPQNIGLFGATGVSMSGGYVDSYDSTQGSYNGIHGSNVSVGTNSTTNGAVNLSGGVVDYGNVYVGPGGNPAKVITTSGGALIYGTKGALSTLKSMTPKSDPGGGTQMMFTNGTTLTSGTYRVSSINLSGSGKGTINGNVKLYVTGSVNLSGSSQIVILSGGSLTIYISGSLNVSGGSIVNQTLNPHNLTIYGTSTCTSASYSGTSALYGVVYAPAASTSISGGVNVYGSVIGRSVTISGGAAVHYDASLGNIGI